MKKKTSVKKTGQASPSGSKARKNDAPAAVSQAASSRQASRWTFLTNHTHVLILLAQNEQIVLREVAAAIGITERAVQRIITDLEEDGFIERHKVGRQNHYRILRQQSLRHPIESHRKIGDILDLICQ